MNRRWGLALLAAAAPLAGCTRALPSEAVAAPVAGGGADPGAAATSAAPGAGNGPPRAGAPGPQGGRGPADLFAAACPGCVAGQVVDHAGQPVANAIIYVNEGLRAGAKHAAAHRPVLIDQRNKAFAPHLVPVQAGSDVVFKNSDMVLHNVYARSPMKTVDLGAFGHDQTRQTSFSEPGRVDVFCAIHTNMHAILFVLDNPFFATSDERGYFEIHDLPPGEYGLKVWTEQRREAALRTRLTADRPAVVKAELP
jgi:plastocyanin